MGLPSAQPMILSHAIDFTSPLCSGDTPGVTMLGTSLRIVYLALSVCATFTSESSDTAASENYTVSTTVMSTRLCTLT
ncbi:hypothetical protein KCU81_g289, partial [Aureobasidium melanogenum]